MTSSSKISFKESHNSYLKVQGEIDDSERGEKWKEQQ